MKFAQGAVAALMLAACAAASAAFSDKPIRVVIGFPAGGPLDQHARLLSDRLHTLPPTFVATAEHDPLRDEGEELARLVAETGVETVGIRCLGQVHGFWRHPQFAAAEPLVRTIAGWFDQHVT